MTNLYSLHSVDKCMAIPPLIVKTTTVLRVLRRASITKLIRANTTDPRTTCNKDTLDRLTVEGTLVTGVTIKIKVTDDSLAPALRTITMDLHNVAEVTSATCSGRHQAHEDVVVNTARIRRMRNRHNLPWYSLHRVNGCPSIWMRVTILSDRPRIYRWKIKDRSQTQKMGMPRRCHHLLDSPVHLRPQQRKAVNSVLPSKPRQHLLQSRSLFRTSRSGCKCVSRPLERWNHPGVGCLADHLPNLNTIYAWTGETVNVTENENETETGIEFAIVIEMIEETSEPRGI